ncbi:MAG: TlpA family protein disulfide reductase [Fimbriimonadaceae bacterium]|nr:TlpA family protein disulfide reductase [Chthonomonadaceae bacterium]MCO5297110.1 TlpA family protein disulfide reductase [Fimbriimonadaceae bacterium]
MVTLLLTGALLASQGGGLTFVPSGMTAKMGGYIPIRAEMSADATGVAKRPGGLQAPMFGSFAIEGKRYAFILDDPDGGTAQLYVDSNADGDLTNDPATTWAPRKQGEMTMYFGGAQVLVHGDLASVVVYKFDKNDPQRAALKNTLLYYTDFGYQGKLTVGGKTYPIAFAGGVEPTTRLWVDRNGNGKSDGRAESISADKPFNFGGTTYELKIVDGAFQAVTSSKSVEEFPLPPDLSVGAMVPTFQATATDGTKVSFPKSYAGKIVMVDFWATWCGPCIQEMPNVIKAYEKYHDKGFEILGISFDQANAAEKVAAFTKEHSMPWKQVYEGKYWDTTIGKQFGVEGIPFGLLVDGDTGKVLASGNAIRGAALEKAIEAALANRKGGG